LPRLETERRFRQFIQRGDPSTAISATMPRNSDEPTAGKAE
jgi:hypothetical protein